MDETRGICHICRVERLEEGRKKKLEEVDLPVKGITFCEVCKHWFCRDCRGKWWARGIEAVMEKVGGRVEGCCGPLIQPAA